MNIQIHVSVASNGYVVTFIDKEGKELIYIYDDPGEVSKYIENYLLHINTITMGKSNSTGD